MKNAALSPSYNLTLSFIGPTEIKRLNNLYRNKNKPTDILSFPLSKDEGEIYICASESRREAHNFDRPYNNFLAFLFIHGCVHLKGYDHGSRMESIEATLRQKFGV
jgi:probable rRNA maturation factor